jgi:hypothetical protein
VSRLRILSVFLALAGLSCSPREAAVRIEMRSSADRARLGEGWSGFEGHDLPKPFHFCWVEGTVADIDVGALPRSGVVRLRIAAWPFAPEGLPPQRIQLWLNELFLDERPMPPGPTDYTWSFPAALLQQGGNRLHLIFARANRPQDTVPGGTDARELSAAVEVIEIAVRRSSPSSRVTAPAARSSR